jgi:hypothetical protein
LGRTFFVKINHNRHPNCKAYEGTVFAGALKRRVRVVVVHYLNKQGKVKKVHTFFFTDCSMQGTDIFLYYKGRFQIEFLYRDAKQFVSL